MMQFCDTQVWVIECYIVTFNFDFFPGVPEFLPKKEEEDRGHICVGKQPHQGHGGCAHEWVGGSDARGVAAHSRKWGAKLGQKCS